MKFVKHATVLVAASALVLTAGVGAAYATTESAPNSETGALEATAMATWDSFSVDNFKVESSVDSFTMSFDVQRPWLRSDAELQLGIFDASGQLLLASATSTGAGVGVAEQSPELDQIMAELNKDVYNRLPGAAMNVQRTIGYVPSGPYSVSLFEVKKSAMPRILAEAKIDVIPVTPAAPTFDAKSSTLTVPDSKEFTYQDSTGKIWVPGTYVIAQSVKLTAVPNPGFAAAPEAATDWPEFAPEVKPAPETKPEKETTPGDGKDKSPETDKDKNIDEKPTTGGGLPPASAPNENQLSPALEGKVGAQPTAVAGAQVKIFVGTQFAGKEVEVYVFSEPTYLGRHKVDSDGNVTVTLPAGLTGSHRLAVYDGGELIGWNRIIISDSTDGAAGTGFVAGTVTTSRLATTGSEATGTLALLAAGSVVLGAAGLVARRRARRSVA